MLLSLRKNGLTSLFKEVRVFKVGECPGLKPLLNRTQSVSLIPLSLLLGDFLAFCLFFDSGVAPANQTKERPVRELSAGAFHNKTSICEFRACFPKEKHQNSHKNGREIHMNFSFCPFLWFGLPGRLLIDIPVAVLTFSGTQSTVARVRLQPVLLS